MLSEGRFLINFHRSVDAEESKCFSTDGHVASKPNQALIMKEERDRVYWVGG